MTEMCKIVVEIEMVLEGDSTKIQAEDEIIDWMDRIMLYEIGHNEVCDKKKPRISDYDVRCIE